MLARYPIYCVKDEPESYLVIMQYPGLDTGPGILVAPLINSETLPELPVITVPITLKGKNYILATHQISAFPIHLIGDQVGDLDNWDYEISRAIDRLFFGN